MGANQSTGVVQEIVDFKTASSRFAPDELAMLQKAFKLYGSGTSIDKLAFVRNTLSMIPEPVQTVSCCVMRDLAPADLLCRNVDVCGCAEARV